MKMSRETFEQICSSENIFAAWARFSSGKHSKADVAAFEYRLEDNLFALRESMISGSYRHDPYKPFTIYDPKQRRIHKATVKDRVVHQAIVNVIEPFFESRFIHDSYSCRIGKGTHAAVDRLRKFLRQASLNDTRTVYALKCDVKRFFASMDHGILFTLLKRRITDSRTLRLLTDIVGSFRVTEQRGIPLGNLTSQLFANVFLHELDRQMKMTLHEAYYIRYCDDFIILSESRNRLKTLTHEIDAFLKEALSLTLHPGKLSIRTWRQGIDFLGYVILPKTTVVRTKTVQRMLKRATQDNLPSYLGICSHADAHELRAVLLNETWIP
ncbi:MAG: reverse transcriptase domain-containing protein [Patescibacteria group bacterium]